MTTAPRRCTSGFEFGARRPISAEFPSSEVYNRLGAYPEGPPVKTKPCAILTVFGLWSTTLLPLAADEGMWLFNRPPHQLLNERYGFKLERDWLENSQKASA